MKTLDYIEKKIAQLPKKKMDDREQAFIRRYLGSNKEYLGAKTADILEIAKEIAKDQDNIQPKELIEILNKLFKANTFEEHAVGGKIFTLLTPENRAKVSFAWLEKWLSKTKGWVEVDTICQSSFTGEEVLKRWDDWAKTIQKFSQSPIISLRRASLVLQTLSARKVNEEKLRKLAFKTIDRLKYEKDILITKAVSWLLRSLTWQDKEEVRKYLLANETTLPRIAFRETMKKIDTGKK